MVVGACACAYALYVIDYAAFGDHVEAHLEYALSLSSDEAANIFRQRIEDGTWLQCPERWTNLFAPLVHRSGDTSASVRQTLEDVVRRVIDAPRLTSLQHAVLRPLFSITQNGLREVDIALVAKWWPNAANVGDASLAADILDDIVTAPSRDVLGLGLVPIANWLVQNATAELQSRRRLWLAIRLVPLIHRHGDPALLWASVTCVLDNEQNLHQIQFIESGASGQSFTSHFRELLAAMEHLLSTGEETVGLVASLCRCYDVHSGGLLLARLARGEFARLRDAALDTLQGGLVELPIAERAWREIIKDPAVPHRPMAFASHEYALAAVRALHDRIRSNEALPTERAWAQTCTEALLVHRRHVTSEDRALLRRCLGFPAHYGIDEGIGTALREHLAVAGQANALASTLLSVQPTHAGQIFAALTLLDETATVPPGSLTVAKLESAVTEKMERILRSSHTHRYRELTESLSACRQIAFADSLDNEFKVAIAGDTLRVDRAAVAGLLRAGLDGDELIAAGVLYVVHEVVHLIQHIGDKTDVARLRSTGAETTLMHVDLGADHVAAIVTNVLVPEWSITFLTDVIGRSLAAFPTEAHHTTAARSRKGHRLVGARLDFFARDQGLLPVDADQYAFAEYGPSGGNIVLMRSGPPWGLLGVSSLSQGDARTLYAAADERGTARIDAILTRAVADVLSRRR